jgi:hypothetical protein
LGVEVKRDLFDTPVEIGDVLRDESLDALPVDPLDDSRFGQQRRFDLERLSVDLAVKYGRVEIAYGEKEGS